MVGVHRGNGHDGHLAFTGPVGTGYGQETVKQLMPHLKAAAAGKAAFGGKDAPKGGRDIHWLTPTLVAESRVCRMDRRQQRPAGRLSKVFARGQVGRRCRRKSR